MSLRDHLDKVGMAASFVAAACCMGLPAIVSILAALGLGFLINDAILRPLMIAFLAVAFIGLLFGFRVHRRLWALVIAAGRRRDCVSLHFCAPHRAAGVPWDRRTDSRQRSQRAYGPAVRPGVQALIDIA